MKKFDLNIEKILENWENFYAVREIIANAIDEQVLSKSKEIELFKKDNVWIVRDYGRGIKYNHLTQNENDEKLRSTKVIGKFGIGLKDALATLYRNGVEVTIKSKFGKITTELTTKRGFEDISTLHALIDDENAENDFEGTEFILRNISDEDIESAKKLFLVFSNEVILDSTTRGQIIERKKGPGGIFINGVKVAEEDNFMFSYNITRTNASIKKALNRERTNVGRSAYTTTIKNIILSSKSKNVANYLGQNLNRLNYGDAKDELQWIDIQQHAVSVLNQNGKYLFVTNMDAYLYRDMIDDATSNGYEIIYVPENLASKLKDKTDKDGNPIINIDEYISSYNDSFDFNFIDEKDLKDDEKEVFKLTDRIIELYGSRPKKVKHIRISKSMRKDFSSSSVTQGCWDESTKSIVIHRRQLKDISKYAGTLIHELIHAKTGTDDCTREFENHLTKAIGVISKICLT